MRLTKSYLNKYLVIYYITVENISKNKEKIYKQNDYFNFVIQPIDQHINLIDAIKLILDFNEELN